jgi:hypothetical protein
MTGQSATGDHIHATKQAAETRQSANARAALAEAKARREAAEASAASLAPEINGPKGAEPTRFGDWERKGIASDF